MIKNIAFSNYRLFSAKQNMRLAPITVILGKNNIGKSAILKLPLLLQSALAGSTSNAFDKTGENGIVLCDEYRDVVYGKANKSVSLNLEADNGACLDVSFIVDKSDEGEWKTIIEKWSIESRNDKLSICWNYNLSKYVEEGNGNEVIFSGIVPQNTTRQEWVLTMLQAFNIHADYIGPVRHKMAREFRLQPLSKGLFSGNNGELNYSYLVKDHLTVQRELFQEVTSWYETNFDGWTLGVDKTRDPLYSLTMTAGGMRNNLQDTGEGIIQSLPVITAICRDYGEPTLLELEEPGTHLHPAAQGPLAELLARRSISDQTKRYLIETHSLNFILRLRALVAMGVLPLDYVELYYVEYDREQCASNLKSVGLRADGSVASWPKDVFNEAFQEALKIRNAQLNQHRP